MVFHLPRWQNQCAVDACEPHGVYVRLGCYACTLERTLRYEQQRVPSAAKKEVRSADATPGRDGTHLNVSVTVEPLPLVVSQRHLVRLN